jgi:hypothetical protein
MFGNGTFAARSTIAAGLAGIVMLTAAPALAAAGAPASSRPGTTAATGSFKSWSAAQRAAGFRLRAPRKTFGLKRRHPILVGRCLAARRKVKKDVFAEWDGAKRTSIALDQNNAGQRCSDFGDAKALGTWRVQGHKAHMFGFCGRKGMPSCLIRDIVLVLEWKGGQHYYVMYSNNEWRRTLVASARSLHRV